MVFYNVRCSCTKEDALLAPRSLRSFSCILLYDVHMPDARTQLLVMLCPFIHLRKIKFYPTKFVPRHKSTITEYYKHLLPLNKSCREPVKTLVKTVSGRGTTGLDVPLTVRRAKSVQSKLVGHLRGTHRIWKILFVGKHQEDGITQFVFVQHSVQLVSCGIDTVRVIGIDNKDKTLRVLVVVTPQRTDLILTTHIPNCERNVLVLDGFDVES